MDLITTLIVLLPYSLPVVPFLIVFAGVVAWAGQKYETRGAFIAAGIISLFYAAVLGTQGHMHAEWWKHILAALLVVVVTIAPILVLMLANRRSGWMRGRLVAGLAGGIISVFVFPYLAITVACDFFGDCL